MDLMTKTRQFWDANPCGIHADYEKQRSFKYATEPWMLPVLHRIIDVHAGHSLLEVGCGQGVDSTVLIPGGVRYTGIDYSPESVAVARSNAAALQLDARYDVGDAENLNFPDASFDAVYSAGVLHHTANERRAISEVHRVLRPGGKAWIALYAITAPKVAVAVALRSLQRGVDKVCGTDRIFYQAIRRYGSYFGPFGTMFHEGFGVPYLKAYTKNEMRDLFGAFSDVKIERYGANLGSLTATPNENPIGYIWQAIATK